MGLFDILRSEFIDIIEWTDDSRDTLSYRWPDEDKEIKNGAQLIVHGRREADVAAADGRQYQSLACYLQAVGA